MNQPRVFLHHPVGRGCAARERSGGHLLPPLTAARRGGKGQPASPPHDRRGSRGGKGQPPWGLRSPQDLEIAQIPKTTGLAGGAASKRAATRRDSEGLCVAVACSRGGPAWGSGRTRSMAPAIQPNEALNRNLPQLPLQPWPAKRVTRPPEVFSPRTQACPRRSTLHPRPTTSRSWFPPASMKVRGTEEWAPRGAHIHNHCTAPKPRLSLPSQNMPRCWTDRLHSVSRHTELDPATPWRCRAPLRVAGAASQPPLRNRSAK